jgi:hypothetical protein
MPLKKDQSDGHINRISASYGAEAIDRHQWVSGGLEVTGVTLNAARGGDIRNILPTQG